jgi:hypothetical protein
MPDHGTMITYTHLLEQHIIGGEKKISFWHSEYNISDLRCGVDFRKYLFGYIRWYENNKEIKKSLTETKDINDIYHIIQQLY